MSDLGKVPGFNTPDLKVETKKVVETEPKSPGEQPVEEGVSLAEVRAKHFIPGQSQIEKDNLATDVKFFMEHPELSEASNDLYDKVYDDYLALGYNETDAAGMAANVQAAFVKEMLGGK